MNSPLRTVERWLRHQRKRWRHAIECRRIMRDAGRVSLDTLAARCSDLETPEFVAVSADAAGGPLATIKNALAGSSAQWIALHDASAVICADAMLWIGLALAAQPHCRAVFADHADADGNSISLHLKPDFSWLYLLANHYIAPLVVYERRALELAIDRLLERDGEVPTTDAALFAIALEVLEDADRSDVLHIRWPLAIAPRRPRLAVEADGLPRIAAAALARRGVAARCSHHPDDPHWHAISLERRSSPRVSIIIPTKNAASLVKRCVASLRDRAGYGNYELLVIDHDSDERELLEYLSQESTAGRLRVFSYSGPFNYAAMNNAAVRQTAGDLILFLNNDIEDFSAGWLDQLVATIEIDATIAAVGCLLYYPDGDIQHAGVVLNPKHLCIHAHVGLPHDAVGYQGRIRCLQEFSAVTAALMLVRRTAFDAAGGFDEVFPDDYNDVDLCLRLRAAGWRVAYTPHVHAIHWESRTRRVKETAKDVFVSRWREHFSSDPFYHPRLSHTEFLPDAFAHLWQERKSLALLEAVTQHESRRHPRTS